MELVSDQSVNTIACVRECVCVNGCSTASLRLFISPQTLLCHVLPPLLRNTADHCTEVISRRVITARSRHTTRAALLAAPRYPPLRSPQSDYCARQTDSSLHPVEVMARWKSWPAH